MSSHPRNQGETDHSFTLHRLPDPTLSEDWSRIYVDECLKRQLAQYLDVLAWLAEQDASIVGLALRRALLLYGEPGNGKTSLARGLPNQWATTRERSALLALVNSHALPSGERGGTQKNVLTLFKQLSEVASNGKPTFLLIDEVESIGTDRASVNPETNPLDTLYAVNAFIESLDHLVRERPNVVCLFTTNIPRAIDRAISERMDFSVHVPLPDDRCRRLILSDALQELNGHSEALQANLTATEGEKLITLTDGFSARQLRHLIVQALTYTQNPADLSLAHLVQVAQAQIAEQQHHTQTGGVYTHEYQR